MGRPLPNPDPAAAPVLDSQGWGYLLSLSFLWSISFVFMKVGAAEIPILTLVLIRVGLAALVLNAVVVIGGRGYPADVGTLARYGLMGLLNNILPGVLIVFATARIGAGAASILNATVPIFSLLIAHMTTADDRITPRRLLGIGLGIAGVAVLAGPDALSGVGGEMPAFAAMLLATFCYGLSNALGRSFRSVDPIVSATCQLSAATLLLAPIALVVDTPWTLPMPSVVALASAVGLALLSTALAYVIFFKLLARAGATNTSLVTLIIPVSGVALAWLLLGEDFTPTEAGGMLLIGAGLVAIDPRLWGRITFGRWRPSRRGTSA